LLNLAYNKRGRQAQFITVLEAHSGKEQEVAVRSAGVSDGVLHVELENGVKIQEAVSDK
jgi:hypothetical protein